MSCSCTWLACPIIKLHRCFLCWKESERAQPRLQAPNLLNTVEEGRKVAKKQIDITLWGAWGRGKACPLVPEVDTPSLIE